MPSGRIPLVKGAFADAVVTAQLCDGHTRFVLFEDADNLFLAESTLSHSRSPCHYFSRRILRRNEMIYWKQVTAGLFNNEHVAMPFIVLGTEPFQFMHCFNGIVCLKCQLVVFVELDCALKSYDTKFTVLIE
jgi:hypothetical protein